MALDKQPGALDKPPAALDNEQDTLPAAPSPQNAVDLTSLPRARVLSTRPTDMAVLESDTQSKHGDLYLLAGDVVITYGDHELRADTITYDASTGDVTASGNMKLTGGENDEYIKASHGTYNLKDGTGHFYDVSGSVGLGTEANSTHRPGYQTPNPFLFSGREVIKSGPTHYDVYGGSVTTCLLPRPDWQLFSNHFVINDQKAHATNSVFRVLGVPLLYLPFVTHPTDTDARQSGLLIPVFGYSSASQNTGSKGITVGEQAYLTLGRSADLTVGSIYYTLRGWSENGTIRYRGPGDNFFNAHFSALQDRGFVTPTVNAQDQPINLYVNQGGQDVTSSFRAQINSSTRAAGDGEYLSSFVYREVFTENFNEAVSSDITSTLYTINEKKGYTTDLRFDRYEGLKVVPILTTPGEIVEVFHAPSFDVSADDHRIDGTPLSWSLNASMDGVKRVQPRPQPSGALGTFDTGVVARFDFRPEISLPLHFDGWNVLVSAAVRDTAYNNSRLVPHTDPPYGPNATPILTGKALNRADGEVSVDIRPAEVERTFSVPHRLQWLLGSEVRHTIEPRIVYRDVQGINNFFGVLRFDDVDLASDTNELDYSLTQHLYFRPRIAPVKKPAHPRPGCPTTPAVHSISAENDQAEQQAQQDAVSAQRTTDANGIPDASAKAPDLPTRTHAHRADPCAAHTLPAQQEWFNWKIEQKYFFNQNFGTAVIDTRRNIFDTTLGLSGIAFLTEPRAVAPVISRMRFRSSGHTDAEWDFDYDTGAKKINSSNIFVDVHEGPYFGGISYALLNAPGRTYSEIINPTTSSATGLTRSATANFSQMRLLSGFGNPSKPGLSAAASAGIDLNAGNPGDDSFGTLQYLSVQASYNWNCCGLSLEYRKYDLGAIRDEGSYRFNFTLANIGTAGNLRRNESLF